jgi:hypothetical protein
MAKKKVLVPKVVVQADPPSRVLLLAVLFLVVAAVAWLSYGFGRAQSPSLPPGSAAAQVLAEAEQRIEALEAERDALEKQVAGLQRDMQLSRQSLETASRKIRALEQGADASQTKLPAARPVAVSAAPPESPAADPAPADNQLRLRDLRLVRTPAADRFRFSFEVFLSGNPSDQVVGTIWIAVNGLMNGKPRRLPLDRVSSHERPFVKMNFTGQQVVEVELNLPPAFNPKNISIEAKPYNEQFAETAEKLDWRASG